MEFKWSGNKQAKLPKDFDKAYPNTKLTLVSPNNFEETIYGKVDS